VADASLVSALRSLTAAELQLLVLGSHTILPDRLLSHVHYDRHVDADTCTVFERVVRSHLSSEELSLLVHAITLSPVMPVLTPARWLTVAPLRSMFRLEGGDELPSSSSSSTAPYVHTSCRRLELRSYRLHEAEVLYSDLQQLLVSVRAAALEHQSAGAEAEAQLARVRDAALKLFPHSCVVCAVVGDVRLSSTCLHWLCVGCAGKNVTWFMDNAKFPARCPSCVSDDVADAVGSDSNLQRGMVESALVRALVAREADSGVSATVADRFERMQTVYALDPAMRVECSACREVFLLADDAVRPLELECVNTACRRKFCSDCLQPHPGVSCEQHQRSFHGNDDATHALLATQSKPCPQCGTRISHYHGHACHHIRPGGGCPGRRSDGTACGAHFCYMCLTLRVDPHRNNCRCPIFCTDTCGCPPCPDCRPGRPCPLNQ
jgi:hypothetical protein